MARMSTDAEERFTALRAMWAAMRPTLLVQVGIVLMSSLVLDGGVIYKCVLTAAISYWLFVLAAVFRRRPRLERHDRWFLKWGFFFWLGYVAVVRSWVA
ncbi:hypothetical protein Pla108_11470 [Botrimarina colliarenosi]|uniref:Uncharacterized protein n=1 Tax=Botrimarina colliarenosi TaxID=2528001 RepID=A0A5C6ALC1_9BACT|nr:hypothetical protein Pla108_11470 [Botrimarina colliarenosi]